MKFKIPSFRLCCSSKRLPTLPSIYCLSPTNPKARDNVYPNLPPPPPPPSTPVLQYMVQNITSNRRANSCNNNPHIVHSDESTFCDSFNKDKKVVKSKGRTSMISSRTITNGLHKHHNHEKDMEEEEVSESLLSCYNSFSDEFCHNGNRPEIPETTSPIAETKLRTFILSEPDQVKVSCTRLPYFNGNKPKKEKFARHGKKLSNTEKVGEGSEKKQMKRKEMVVSRASSMTQRCSSGVEGMVKESFAVVKKSNDPYEDFKKSMMEMMMEMEMLKSEDMERLLQCFLDLNSRCYHGVIVRAFLDIWQQLFCETCVHQKSHNIS
ncbi:hypothetical protein RIF29_06119 [Crotalaria pallida]|uniref:Transcription repressor n=1 Tax=Crotalaria pallida TaxID=3830 RepID=A0AAN9J3W7_CROPI